MSHRILYLPLDERPCNYQFPQMIAKTATDLELLVAPQEILGAKKHPADSEAVWRFVEQGVPTCACAVLSAEMLFFGGLLPSRLHHLPASWAQSCIARLRALKRACPETRLYLFQLIMRTPRYDSADEEPVYWEEFGAAMFRRAYLLDKQMRESVTDEERKELAQLDACVPRAYIEDYEWRREYNISLLEHVLELVDEGVIELLFIPQDDSAAYGYTALDQRRIQDKLRTLVRREGVFMHPGADEAGSELIARAYLDLVGGRPRVCLAYSAPLGHQIVPLYEDRPLGVSVVQHLCACGCQVTGRPEDADFVLAINTPGRVMQEASDQVSADVSYQSFRCPEAFVAMIDDCLAREIPVVLADCAFANGGEFDLVRRLDRSGALDRLVSYKGWNTVCNTIGTSIAQGVLSRGDADKEAVRANVIYHLCDDLMYQARVRSLLGDIATRRGLSCFDLGDEAASMAKRAVELITDAWQETIVRSFSEVKRPLEAASFPWNRLFEISFDRKDRPGGGE